VNSVYQFVFFRKQLIFSELHEILFFIFLFRKLFKILEIENYAQTFVLHKNITSGFACMCAIL